jgi:cytochrome c553
LQTRPSDGIHHVGAMQALTLPQDVEDFKHVGSLVIPDKASPLFGIHHFYLNDKGMAAFKKSGPYPGGHDLRRGGLRGGRSRRGARGVVTYMVAGTQYVATTAGNVSRMTWGTAGSPRVIVMAVDVLEGNPRMMVALPKVAARGLVADAAESGAEAGQQQYEQFCAGCHGTRGEGGGGVRASRLTRPARGSRRSSHSLRIPTHRCRSCTPARSTTRK